MHHLTVSRFLANANIHSSHKYNTGAMKREARTRREEKALENWLPWNQLTKARLFFLLLLLRLFTSVCLLLTGYILWILNSSPLLGCHPIWHMHINTHIDKPRMKASCRVCVCIWKQFVCSVFFFLFVHFFLFIPCSVYVWARAQPWWCVALSRVFKKKSIFKHGYVICHAHISHNTQHRLFYNWLFSYSMWKCKKWRRRNVYNAVCLVTRTEKMLSIANKQHKNLRQIKPKEREQK